MQYVTIDLSNENGFNLAEKLQEEGWVVDSVGFNSIVMKNDDNINQKGE